MATSHGQSLYCCLMGNPLSSLGEALKRMNSIKIGRDVNKWYNLVSHMCRDMAAIEISYNISWT